MYKANNRFIHAYLIAVIIKTVMIIMLLDIFCIFVVSVFFVRNKTYERREF